MDGKEIIEISYENTGDYYGIEPRVVLMAGWLKRLDDFKKIKDFKGFDDFERFDKSKFRLYPSIVNYLSEYYDKTKRTRR